VKSHTIIATSERENQYAMHSETELSSSHLEDYKIGKLLGKGTYAEVRECVYVPTGKMYAIKMYEKAKLIDLQKRRNTIREIQILEGLDHPNIIHLYHIIETTKSVLLILELVDGRSLKDIMRMNLHGLEEKEYLKIFRQILSAVNYIHKRKIAHW
jgi:serine/threonine protein kinase